MRSKLLVFCVFAFLCGSLFAQTHVSVPLDSQVYYILEQAQIRGLCAPLSGVKPYSQGVVVSAINEIIDSDKAENLSPVERSILEQYLENYAKPKLGIDGMRGSYYGETVMGENGIPLTADIRAGVEIEGSSGNYILTGESLFGYEIWVSMLVNGDIGRNVSYELSAEGGLMKVPRQYLGKYNTYYEGFANHGEYENRVIDIYSEPLTHFPYTYRKRWDGSIYFIENVYSFSSWPGETAGAYNLQGELTLSLLDNKFITRISRMPREWGSVSHGSSMHLNQAARPFLAMETEFNPLSWFGIATMTGVLEYYNTAGIKDSAMSFQNAYSITMLQFRYKNYFFLDLGETVVWPKRFEIGYMLPVISTIFYQNNIGDFDNMGAMANLKLQYPGIGNIWASLFWDEAYWVSDFYELDRTMLAGQAGIELNLPFLSFSSLKFSYTKVNPYTYTHNRNYNPWYGGNLAMETSYTNNGVGLGYYLPPNSVEYLARFKTALSKGVMTHLQYQLIQHGADFGSSAVDGSNLLSELDPGDRAHDPRLKRFFLHDGAYQWIHVIKAGLEWNLSGLPVTFFGEAGAVISFFTDTVGNPANSGKAYDYWIVDTSEYPRSTGIIVKLGFKLWAR